jgi:hypothetical protein
MDKRPGYVFEYFDLRAAFEAEKKLKELGYTDYTFVPPALLTERNHGKILVDALPPFLAKPKVEVRTLITFDCLIKL